VVANTSFRAALWADALFAMDRAWWDVHRDEVARDFKGSKFSTSILPLTYGVTRLQTAEFNGFRNSGAGTIELAHLFGAVKVILLGFDCQKTDGKAHWHGNHPAGLGNAGMMAKWPQHFRELAARVKRMEVVNCSRQTALTVFERGVLEDHL
jgi:hypothetical protein